MRILFLFLVLSTLQVGQAMSRAPTREEQRFSDTVGVRTLEFHDQKRNRPVIVELWYPLDRSIEGEELLRDPPLVATDRPHPLILMSHGYRGNRLGQIWLATYLAKQGFLVASVEHYGNTKANFHPLLSLKFWERPKDISFALDQLLEEFEGEIDENKIGFIGYSMGGMTGLGLAGAKAKNVREVVMREYHSHPGFTEELISQIDFSDGEKNYTEHRIKAILLLNPANFVYPPESLKQIKIPVGLVAAFHDEVLPHKDHAYPIICHLVPQKIKVIREKVTHSFLANRSAKAVDEDKIYREVAMFAFSFFQKNFSAQ